VGPGGVDFKGAGGEVFARRFWPAIRSRNIALMTELQPADRLRACVSVKEITGAQVVLN
jgi:hypothetical protein